MQRSKVHETGIVDDKNEGQREDYRGEDYS